MSSRMRDGGSRAFGGLYRDRENGWLFGVCAGMADRFNLNLGAIRVLAVISLVMFTAVTVIVYIAATLLVREKPLVYAGRGAEYEFWRCRRHDHWRHS